MNTFDKIRVGQVWKIESVGFPAACIRYYLVYGKCDKMIYGYVLLSDFPNLDHESWSKSELMSGFNDYKWKRIS